MLEATEFSARIFEYLRIANDFDQRLEVAIDETMGTGLEPYNESSESLLSIATRYC